MLSADFSKVLKRWSISHFVVMALDVHADFHHAHHHLRA
jgi:hypothetical protein